MELDLSPKNNSFEDRVINILLELEFISEEQLEIVKKSLPNSKNSILEKILKKKIISKDVLSEAINSKLGISIIDLKTTPIDPKAIELIPEEFAKKNRILPINLEKDGTIKIATLTPNNFELASNIALITGHQTKFAFILNDSIDEMINKVYVSGVPQNFNKNIKSNSISVNNTNNISPSEFVENITIQAIKRKASDIHIVPESNTSMISFRIDGSLHKVTTISMQFHESIVSRVKVLAEMDISETRRPQDGSFTIKSGERNVDFRVSSMGITWGEMMVVRILERSSSLINLEDLGMESSVNLWRKLLSLPFGMLLVSGPTGSGKTTTLYASVAELIKDRGNIMTVEDPVEYRLEELHQIEVNRQAGIDFSTGLKSIMRMDPDVVLVGEIRDAETAKTAVDAALTGHLVLASIHSNDASSAFLRLLDMGIEPYMAATAVIGCLGQRLVRKLDVNCALPGKLSEHEALSYHNEIKRGTANFKIPNGCNFCDFSGYLGRTGVFEILSVNNDIRNLVISRSSGQEIHKEALKNGLIPLRKSGMIKVQNGITTVPEIMKNVFFID
ncbi:MAG: type II/IV secretion system protein [SAR202 cluster bacterium]|nr:type II/IV secretion system protein [SAR202 cluster bacterium]|tara:strand:- start:29136 stop:30818 length:1683 start_codon:yes stop_codon:yes gene_type:complete